MFVAKFTNMFFFKLIFFPYHLSPPWSIYDLLSWPSHSSWTNFCTERVNSFCPSCTFTTLTWPSDPIIVLVMCPSGQWGGGVSIDSTSTTSSTLNLSFSLFHFFVRIWTWNPFFQPTLPEVFYQLLHSLPFLFQIRLSFINWIWSKGSTKLPIQKMIWSQWINVSRMWWLICCLLLIKLLAPTKRVTSSSSFISAFSNMFLIAFLAALTHELHQNLVLLEDWMTIEHLHLLLSAWSSLSSVDSPNLSILYLLSQYYVHCENITSGIPLWLAIFKSSLKNGSASILKSISKCIAWVFRQVNKHKYRFPLLILLPCIELINSSISRRS